MTETRNTDTGPMCPSQVVQNLPTCVDNWCYYRKATEVRIKLSMNSACSLVNTSIFSSDRRLYIQNYVYAHTFCDLHQYLYIHITTNSHHRLLNFAVCNTAIFSFDDNSIKRNGDLQYICTTSNHKLCTTDPAQHIHQSLLLEMTLLYSHKSTVVRH